MTYNYFLEHIDEYVGHVVEFTARFKANEKTFRTQRYVWNNKEFGKLSADALIEITAVKDIGYKKPFSATVIKAV